MLLNDIILLLRAVPTPLMHTTRIQCALVVFGIFSGGKQRREIYARTMWVPQERVCCDLYPRQIY